LVRTLWQKLAFQVETASLRGKGMIPPLDILAHRMHSSICPLVLPADRNVDPTAHPELAVRVVPVEHHARMEAVAPMALGSRAAQAGLKRTVG
jgi:hypothetical protein